MEFKRAPRKVEDSERDIINRGGVRWVQAYESDRRVGAGQASTFIGVPTTVVRHWMRRGYVPVYRPQLGGEGREMFHRHALEIGQLLAAVRRESGMSPNQWRDYVADVDPDDLWALVRKVAELAGLGARDDG